jgi:pilus assembly protein Flp/PilA
VARGGPPGAFLTDFQPNLNYSLTEPVWTVFRGLLPPWTGNHCSSDRKEEFMHKFAQHALEFLKAEDGPTAVEYAVMLSLIIIVCLVSITVLGSNANQTFTKVSSAIAPS